MKKAIIILVGLTAALLIAGCTSPTTNNTTPSVISTSQDLSATLDSYFAAHYTLVDNFTRASDANETPVYSGSFQETNGTLHSVTIYLANSTIEAEGQFEAQKASYVDAAAMPNATLNANTTTHWAVTSENTLISVWLTQASTAGPFGLSLNAPYVLVSQDLKPPVLPTETAAPVTEGAG
ncbi:MAG: hypothetical protein WBZ42_04205 [Halobacteriota archaeon]